MIRAASAADVERLVALSRALQHRHADAEPGVYRRSDDRQLRAWLTDYLGRPGCEALLYERGAETLGYAALRYGRRDDSPYLFGESFVYVDQVSVAARARRQGVGRALMAAVERRARALGAEAVELDVRAINDEARAFYAALGYAPSRVTLRRGLG